jgi:hypothetical protein
MAAKGLIENIELKISSANWNEVTLSEYANGRRIEHTYYSMPKKLVMKLLNSTGAPTISDFEGWVKDFEQKERKDDGKAEAVPANGNDWFNCRD